MAEEKSGEESMMRKHSSVVNKLMSEVCKVCSDADIPYITGGMYPEILMTKAVLQYPLADLYIHESNMQKLAELLKENLREDRRLEIISDDSEIISYVDPSTVMIDFSRIYRRRYQGMCVQIRPYSVKDGKVWFMNSFELPSKMPESMLNNMMTEELGGVKVRVPADLTAFTKILYNSPEGIRNPSAAYGQGRFLSSTGEGFEAFKKRFAQWDDLAMLVQKKKETAREDLRKLEESRANVDETFEKIRKLYL